MKATVAVPRGFLKSRSFGVSPMLPPGATDIDKLFPELQDEIQEWITKQGYEIKILMDPTALEFSEINAALKFKLAMGQWEHLKYSEYDPVLLPLIRRVMPNVIAHSIIGAQPMTGPVNGIHALRARYASNNGDSNGTV